MRPPRVAVVIPVWNSERWLKDCLAALARQTFRDFQVIIVDDASSDGAVTDLETGDLAVEILRLPSRRGFAGAANRGIAAGLETTAELIALLNVDTHARPGWLEHLVASIDRLPQKVGALASKMLLMETPHLMDDAGNELSWWGSGQKCGHGKPAHEYQEAREVFSVCAGAALYRRTFFERVGLFDEEFESYFEDLDLGLRGRLLGYSYWYVPEAEVLHFGHGTGLPRAVYVKLVTRNRALTLLKNIPAALLVRHAFKLLVGQLYFLVAYRRPWQSARGYLSLSGKLNHIRKERLRIARDRVLTLRDIDRLLNDSLGEPSLFALMRRRWHREAETRG